MNLSTPESAGEEGESRKGRRELSTSKRAAQNRAAQVRDFFLSASFSFHLSVHEALPLRTRFGFIAIPIVTSAILALRQSNAAPKLT
jgi:hypothetical protein